MNTDMHRVTSLVVTEENHTLDCGTPYKVITITGKEEDGTKNTFQFFTGDTAELTLTII